MAPTTAVLEVAVLAEVEAAHCIILRKLVATTKEQVEAKQLTPVIQAVVITTVAQPEQIPAEVAAAHSTVQLGPADLELLLLDINL